MREIKFRAWDRINEPHRMVFWAELVYRHDLALDLADQAEDDSTPFVYMQYTGLKDKQGKEIYEGDIVYSGGLNCTVIWQDFDCRFVLLRHGKQTIPQTTSLDKMHLEQVRVIGNIYENPDLLRVVHA